MIMASVAEKIRLSFISVLLISLFIFSQLRAQNYWTFPLGSDSDISLAAAEESTFIYQTGEDLTEAGVSVGLDGTVYAASLDGTLYAVDSLGNFLWSYETGSPIYSVPLISADGSVTFAAGMEVIRLDNSGKLLWSYETTGTVFAPLAESVDGAIYVSDFNKALQAISWDGSLSWQKALGQQMFGTVRSGPVIDTDGTIYVGLDKLYALDSSGDVVWSFTPTDGRPSAQAVPSGDGLVFFPTADSLYALDTGGTKVWSYPAGSYASPVLDGNGHLYIGSNSDSIYVFNQSTGTKVRAYARGGDVYHLALAADGTLFAGSADSTLSAFDPQGTELFSFKAGGSIEGPIAVAFGRVYFSATDGNLYSIETDASGPDSLSWATSGGSNQRRSRALVVVDSLEAGMVRHVFRSGSSIFSSSAVDKSGNYYFGSHEGYLYSVTPFGDIRWKFLAAGEISQSPAIGADGSVFFGTTTGMYYSLSESGKVRWQFSGSGIISGMVAVRADGATFFRQDGVIRAVSSLGNELWSYPVAEGNGNLVIDGSGTLYFTEKESDYSLVALGSDGRLKWQTPVDDTFLGGHVAISPDSAFYLVGTKLHRLAYDGTPEWSLAIDEIGGLASNQFMYSAVVDSDSTVYLCDNIGGLYAIRPDKSLHWKQDMDAAASSAPVISFDNRIYVAQIGNSLAAYDQATGDEIWSSGYGLEFDTSDLQSFVNLSNNGDLFINTRNSGMLVVASGSDVGLDSLGWAKPGRNAGNSANYSDTFVPPVKSCDYSGDGFVSISDVIFLLLRGQENPSDPDLDWNNDGRYTVTDAVRLLFDIRDGLCPGQNAVLASAAGLGRDDIRQLLDAIIKLNLSADERTTLMSAIDNLNESGISLPRAFKLEQNHPNPFNPSTTISFQVPQDAAGRVTLLVYDLRGRIVRTLIDETREPGVHTAFWNGQDDSGQSVASGVYLYRLKAGDFVQTRKMVLLK